MDTGLQIRQDGNLCHQEAHSLVWEIEERECNLYFFFLEFASSTGAPRASPYSVPGACP